jgi:dihydrofolate synthase/folylpolyglutamate synthase
LHRVQPELGRLTTYEIGTGLALEYFADQRVDWAVLEVGLGGRLDAVNVVEPLLAVLTPISLDHMDILGPTLRLIAREKAGVIHAGSVVVSAPQPDEAHQVIQQACQERGATLVPVDVGRLENMRPRRFGSAAPLAEMRATPFLEFDYLPAHPGLALPLGGFHQAINAAVALEAVQRLRLELTPLQVRSALAGVRWPGRLEPVGERPTTLVDGAHNDASAAALARAVRDHFDFGRLVLVLGTSADKDLEAILSPLLPLASAVFATQARNPRALPAPEVGRVASAAGAHVEVVPSVTEALDRARFQADHGDLVLATGSLYVVAEARAHLGWAQPEPTDPREES